jgi:hypothetical protein
MKSSVVLLLLATASCSATHDWPMFGRDATRNAVSPEKDPPTDWSLVQGKERNVLWKAKLGDYAQAPPIVADGLVWIGTGERTCLRSTSLRRPSSPSTSGRGSIACSFRSSRTSSRDLGSSVTNSQFLA